MVACDNAFQRLDIIRHKRFSSTGQLSYGFNRRFDTAMPQGLGNFTDYGKANAELLRQLRILMGRVS